MELARSLHRDILESQVGSILNKIHFKKRRNIMFFEDIFAQYVQECEKAGYEKEMYAMGEKWFSLVYYRLVSPFMKSLPKQILLPMLGNVWRGIGALDDIKVNVKGDTVELNTKNEAITRSVGPNQFMVGVFAGAYSVIIDRKLECTKKSQSKEKCNYTYSIGVKLGKIETKNRERFNKLNQMKPLKGFTIKDALRSGVFTSKENKLYFRGKVITTADSTIYHMVGNKKILLNCVAPISYNFFKDLIVKESTNEAKLKLLKTFLQIMGWGAITISGDMKKRITFNITNPPYGFQREDDNWDFLFQVILGYLWLLDKNFRLVGVIIGYHKVTVKYTT